MTKKARQGSESRRSQSKKDVPFNIRVSGLEKVAFADAARLAGIPLSAWVRERLRLVAIRELEAAAKPIAFLSNER